MGAKAARLTSRALRSHSWCAPPGSFPKEVAFASVPAKEVAPPVSAKTSDQPQPLVAPDDALG
jgi:hypothetical protein